MYYIIPVQNLVLDKVVKFKDSFLVPSNINFIRLDFNAINYDDVLLLENILNYDEGYFTIRNVTCIVLKKDYNYADILKLSSQGTMDHLRNICFEADSYLDCIRLRHCMYGDYEKLPSMAGIYEGIQRGIVIDVESKNSLQLMGYIMVQSNIGIGCYPEITEFSNDFFSSNRKDEIYVNLRTGIRRINEIYYMTNMDVAYIYLFATIDGLISKEYETFKKTKSKFISFLTNNKEIYNRLSDKYKIYSRDIRTALVHKGLRLYDLKFNNDTGVELINMIIGDVTTFIYKVFYANVITFEEMYDYIGRLQKQMGIKI